ncbi:Nop domain [Trypanosoma melophagium]|uniref:Nop domain n=1 Tax=Trypanosoma melophagium TaxID=715481 RepID=UPI00351A501A|nr:Nop domain [Trypanosoma melophagium]
MTGSAPVMLPNLSALVGRDVANKLVEAAGGVVALARLSDAALRHLGLCEEAQFQRARHLHAGYLAESPIFVEFFGADDVRADELRAAKKALAVLARKCCIAAKADLSGGAATDELGEREREKLRHTFELLLAEGKVNAIDTQALPVPHVFVRGEETKKKRGGRKEFRKQQAQKDAPSALERAVSHLKMGVSEEEQIQTLMLRSDVRAELLNGVAKPREQRKRQRDEKDDEYDDLMQIRL